MIEELNVPKHVAIILDGNGRWAKKRGLPRTAGHKAGSDNVEVICRAAHDLGIKYLTLYAFSTENWKRAESEVNALMTLLGNYLDQSKKKSKDNDMRVRVIGDITRLSPSLQSKITEIEEFSKDFGGLCLTIALNYGSRDEIRRAVTKISEDTKNGKISPDEISEELISSYLDTSGMPDPDLMIRTSNEIRLSNYLLWQLAYAEFYFTETYWPDFGPDDLKAAVLEYSHRNRRFGDAK